MINKNVLYFLFFVTAISICTGSFFEVAMNGTGKDELMSILSTEITEENDISFFINLQKSFLPLLKIWAFLLLCPLIPPIALICPFICIFKGLSVGFASTMLIEIFGTKGTLYILSTIMPHSILQLPLICILSSLSIKYSIYIAKYYFETNNRKKNKNVLQNSARHYLTIFLSSLIIFLISSLIEVCLRQFLL